MWLEKRKLRSHPEAIADWSVIDFRKPRVRRITLAVIALSAVNLVILLLAGYGTLHWMESPSFCGQACHEPMHPQFTAWQANEHSGVRCTDCHIGEGARAFLHYKFVGVRQLYHVITRQIPRPIPGVADLRPALEVCGNCHWPNRDLGDRVRVIREYADDEPNTETTTVLHMFTGGPGKPTRVGRAIHWHADPRITITYVATDKDRQTIPWVQVTDAQGQVREYVTEGTTPEQLAQGERRTMDCVTCHNVVAHRISPTAERAVDEAIGSGEISRKLPFVRREGVRLVKADYGGSGGGSHGRSPTNCGSSTRRRAARLRPAISIRRSTTLQGLYRRNVFPVMKITWGVYPDNLGHITSSGCFRCHDGGHVAKDGAKINDDCEYCHRQVDVPPVTPTAPVPPK